MRYLLIFLLLVSCVAIADPPADYPFVGYDAGLQQAQEQKKHIFVYFGRHGCGFCAKTNKESFSDPGLKKRYIENYILVYVDAESGNRLTLPTGERITESELGAQLNVFATPIFMYLDMNGEVLFRAPGYKTVKDFVHFDQYIQQGHYKTKSINEFISKQ
ncbi:MAG: thioredoxin fold domain-containing protein [Gammaproteobacteria bacterium]|jgi:thioredoxin-related protein